MDKRLKAVEKAIREIREKIGLDAYGEEKTQNLTFGEALLHLKAGNHVSRWMQSHIYIWLSDADDNILPVIWVNTVSNEQAPWHPNHSDLLADNWRVVEKHSD